MISFYFVKKKRKRMHTIKKFVNLVVMSQNCKFQRKPWKLENGHISAKKSKIILFNLPLPPQPPPAIKSHRLISLCYSWSSAKSNPREIKILFWKVYVSLLYIFFYHKQVLSLAQLSLCLSMSVYI